MFFLFYLFILIGCANTSSKSRNVKGPIIDAIVNGNNNDLRRVVIDNMGQVDAEIDDGLNPLLWAVNNNNLEAVDILLKFGANVNFTAIVEDEFIGPPLVDSALFGFEGISERLIRSGADTSYGKENGYSALHAACEHNREGVVRLLLNEGANVNIKTEDSLYTPLHLAAERNLVNIIAILIDHNAIVDEKGVFGIAPIHLACIQSNIDAAKELIRNGANIYEKTALACPGMEVKTPLDIAAFNGDEAIVQLLINNKVLDNNFDSTLFIVCSTNKNKILQLIINSYQQIMYYRCELVYVACEKGHLEIIKTLIRSGARLHFKKNGLTPIHIACQNGHTEVVRELMDSGASIMDINERGENLMITALQNRNGELIDLLMRAGVKTR